MGSANDRQVAGEHYGSVYQHWDFVKDMGLDYFKAQVAKYLTRWRKKNGVQDLEKALHFAEKLEEIHKEHTNLIHDYARSNELNEDEEVALLHIHGIGFQCLINKLNSMIEAEGEASTEYVNQDR